MPNINLIKPNIETCMIGLRPFKMVSMRLPHKSFGDVFVKSFITNPKIDECRTHIIDPKGVELGFEEYAMFSNNKMSGFYIETEKNFRQKGFKIGELLRLTSIIEFIENKMTKLDIHSAEDAIMFHSKYKFEPNIMHSVERDCFLNTVLKDYKCRIDNEPLTNKAKSIIGKMLDINSYKCDYETSKRIYKEAYQETNELAKEYIKYLFENTKNPKDCYFENGINMTLTKEKILENKDFFNKLFKENYIDYSI